MDHPGRACQRMEKPVLPALPHHPPPVITECVCVCERNRDRDEERGEAGWEGFLMERTVGYCLVPTAKPPPPQRGGLEGNHLASLRCTWGPQTKEKGKSKAMAHSPITHTSPSTELITMNWKCLLSCLPRQLDLEMAFRQSGPCIPYPCRRPST